MIEFHENVNKTFPLYLNDESNLITNGFAERIYFPKTEDELVEIIKEANEKKIKLTISGAGTGICGGRVPLGGWIIATDKMKSIISDESEDWLDPETNLTYNLKLKVENQNTAYLTLPIAITVKAIQNFVRLNGWFYPPDTTERSSYIGGNFATNASGARCFKFGGTQQWVEKCRIILADGTILNLNRSQNNGFITDNEIILNIDGKQTGILRPSFHLPKVTKNVAGPVITSDMHPLDLFIGTNGIFGIVSEVTIKLMKPPNQILSIFVYCDTNQKAIDFIKLCQGQRREGKFPIPLSVEYLDSRAVEIIRNKDKRIKKEAKAVIMLEQDTYTEEEFDQALEFWNNTFTELNILDSDVAMNFTEIEHHKMLRHSIPDYLISVSKKYDQPFLVTDYSVPEEKLEDLMQLANEYGGKFELYQQQSKENSNEIGYVLFGHLGDSHIHLTLIPRNDEESAYVKGLFNDFMHKIVNMGGTIASEHGLGKKIFENKPAIALQYGDKSITEIKNMKKVLDPNFILNPGNLIPII